MNDNIIYELTAMVRKRKLALENKLAKFTSMAIEHSKVLGCRHAFFKSKPITVAGTFSGISFAVPMKIRGELLRAGEYYTGNISAGELKKAYEKLVSQNNEVLVFSTHNAYWENNTNVNDVLGKLYKFSWDAANDAIMYEGEIIDENGARKIHSMLVEGISAGFLYQTGDDGFNRDIEIKEATLTFKPHCSTAYVKPIVEA